MEQLSQKQLDIINTAAELFNESGYHQTNLNQIATAVGIKKPTLYHYFESKSQILNCISDRLIDVLIERHERRLETPTKPDRALLAMMTDVLELMETHPGHVRVFLEFQRELPREQRLAIGRKRAHYQAMLEDVVTAGANDGTFRALPPRLTALGVFGMVNWAYQWFDLSGALRAREVAEAFWDLAVRGLGQPGGNGRT